MWIILGIGLVVVTYLLFELRAKKPDQIVLFEKNNEIKIRKGNFYPRHSSMAIQGTTFSSTLHIDSEAKGKLGLNVKLTISVAASIKNLKELIRVGGWNKNSVANTSKEVEVLLQGLVRSCTEKYEIEDLSSELLSNYLNEKLGDSIPKLGLDIVGLTIQSIEPVDKKIAEAMKQQEAARIIEENEIANQKARINSENIRLEADEKIAIATHQLELKKYELKKVEEEKESELADKRIADEIKRKNLQLELDRNELSILKDNPELLLLSPQAAKLAEASQNLKNARTVVSLAPGDVEKGSQIIDMFGNFLQTVFSKKQTEKLEDKK